MQQEETPKVRRIRQVSVKNLFGIFNHTLPLNMDERTTIIHGPNGFGKTMMLKLLHELFSLNNHLLQTIPFDEFRVDFEDGTSFWVSKSALSAELVEDEQPNTQKIIFNFTTQKPHILHTVLFLKESIPIPLSYLIADLIPSLEPTGTWRHIPTDEKLSSEDIVKRFADQLPPELLGERTNMPAWLLDMRKSVPLRFIETQRLVNSTRPTARIFRHYDEVETEYAVTGDSKHLIDVISKKLAESARLSQSLDRTFPVRLINPTTQQLQVKADDLVNKLKKLEDKRKRLMETGLLDQETGTTFPVGYDQEIESSQKAVLAVYAEDTERKLGIFDELAQKIDLLTTIINNRFLYKTMTIDKEQGLVLTSQIGAKLPLEDLSSGEQHELVLFYELLFRVTPGSLILIDEPELSLHVVWQEQFLKDVQQVAKLTNIDIILATHSPDLINNRRDLVIELEAPKHGGL